MDLSNLFYLLGIIFFGFYLIVAIVLFVFIISYYFKFRRQLDRLQDAFSFVSKIKQFMTKTFKKPRRRDGEKFN